MSHRKRRWAGAALTAALISPAVRAQDHGVVLNGSRLFVRGGVVGQAYGNAGSATTSLGTFSLIGGQAAVGVNY